MNDVLAVDAGATGSATVQVIHSRQGVEALAPHWLALDGRSEGLTLFQSLGWARAIFDFEASRNNAAFEPVIAALFEGQDLVAVLPLERVRTGTRTVLAPLGQAFGQYADMLLRPGVDAAEALSQMLRAATDAAPADMVSFLKVREGSALERGLPKTRIATGQEQGAPFVALDQFDGFEAYFQTIKSKTRKNMRNARNRLEREAPLEHRPIVRPSERTRLIERTLSGRAERLKDQGLTSRAFRDAGFIDFCRSLPSRADLELQAFSLVHGGEPIAEQWGFVHNRRYYAFVATRDFSNSEESPGKLHLGEVIRACSDRGLAGCDLGVPAMPYKLTWATRTDTVRDYALPLNPRGWALVQVWDVWLRPVIKSVVLRIPAGPRALLMRLAGHGH